MKIAKLASLHKAFSNNSNDLKLKLMVKQNIFLYVLITQTILIFIGTWFTCLKALNNHLQTSNQDNVHYQTELIHHQNSLDLSQQYYHQLNIHL